MPTAQMFVQSLFGAHQVPFFIQRPHLARCAVAPIGHARIRRAKRQGRLVNAIPPTSDVRYTRRRRLLSQEYRSNSEQKANFGLWSEAQGAELLPALAPFSWYPSNVRTPLHQSACSCSPARRGAVGAVGAGFAHMRLKTGALDLAAKLLVEDWRRAPSDNGAKLNLVLTLTPRDGLTKRLADIRRSVICQEMPQRSLHQPQAPSTPDNRIPIPVGLCLAFGNNHAVDRFIRREIRTTVETDKLSPEHREFYRQLAAFMAAGKISRSSVHAVDMPAGPQPIF